MYTETLNKPETSNKPMFVDIIDTSIYNLDQMYNSITYLESALSKILVGIVDPEPTQKSNDLNKIDNICVIDMLTSNNQRFAYLNERLADVVRTLNNLV